MLKLFSYMEIWMSKFTWNNWKGLFRIIARILFAGSRNHCMTQWYKKFDSFMVSYNYTRSEYDHCVYFKKLNNGIFIILVLYVDDMFLESK
jgi:hypothetical protein